MNTTTMEASRLIRVIAPPAEGHNIKSRIAKAARRLAWSFNRAKDVWFADGRIVVRANEIDRLRELAGAETKAAKNELHELRATVARLMDRIDRIDADFYGPQADAMRDQLRRLDGTSGPSDRT